MPSSNCITCEYAAHCALFTPFHIVPSALCGNPLEERPEYKAAQKASSKGKPTVASRSGKIMDMPTGARDFLFNTWRN